MAWYFGHGILDVECVFLTIAAMEFLGYFQAILFRPQIIFRAACHKQLKDLRWLVYEKGW